MTEILNMPVDRMSASGDANCDGVPDNMQPGLTDGFISTGINRAFAVSWLGGLNGLCQAELTCHQANTKNLFLTLCG